MFARFDVKISVKNLSSSFNIFASSNLIIYFATYYFVREIGKVVGGTKGNLILEYVSGSPNKETVTEDPPNPLDYDELTKYGYGNLVTRIMNAGGRLKMYELLDLTPPPVKPKKVTIAPPIVIDRFGEQTRYQGLKLGQAFNDNMQAVALQEVQEKLRNGERPASSKVLEEVEAFELPFADKRNVSPKQTPDWTVEKLDEWGRQQGRVESWARKAKQGAFVQDPMESFDSLLPQQRLYSIVTALTVATAFGKATPSFVSMVSGDAVTPNLLSVLQIPAAALLLASLGSSAYCAMTAKGKNRSQYVWTLKGLLGGPLTVRQLATLSTLITQQEQDDQDRAHQKDAS
jgi:hypothetical protein